MQVKQIRLAQQSMKNLSPDVVAAVQSKVLFSREEEEFLADMTKVVYGRCREVLVRGNIGEAAQKRDGAKRRPGGNAGPILGESDSDKVSA